MKKLLLIALLIAGCNRWEYIDENQKFDKMFGKTYIKTEIFPPDSTMPMYVAKKILEWRTDKSRIFFATYIGIVESGGNKENS